MNVWVSEEKRLFVPAVLVALTYGKAVGEFLLSPCEEEAACCFHVISKDRYCHLVCNLKSKVKPNVFRVCIRAV